MLIRRLFLLSFLLASTALAAEPVELQPLKGDKLKGDFVSLTEKEIVLQIDGKPVSTPLDKVLQLDFRPMANNKDLKYTAVELVDGSRLNCTDLAFKGKEVTLTLLSGQTVKVPFAALNSVMKEANDVHLTAAWKEMFAGKKRNFDAVVAKTSAGVLNQLEGTFYDASDDGKRIEFMSRGSDVKAKLILDNIFGMALLRLPDPNLPSLLCKLQDTQGSTLMVHRVVSKEGKISVATQCGAQAEYPLALLAQLDYSKGKLTYLSDIELSRVKVVENSPLGDGQHFRRDKNLDGEGLIQIDGKTYPKGLAMHAYCDLTFDLDGEYREFQAIVGIDQRVGQGSDGGTILRIEGDGKELKSLTLTRKDNAHPLILNIRDVHKLRIIVTSDDVLNLGRHLDLADAKVSK